ncbi:hypothetical protein [Novipirellula maiorica]|uniref:hypothetical protein n=1 Tax=Novipirellula maiorica TaxID=1265734 RepID=UPI001181B486|nr:hypothetical protein [Rhodopirellula maiorica]
MKTALAWESFDGATKQAILVTFDSSPAIADGGGRGGGFATDRCQRSGHLRLDDAWQSGSVSRAADEPRLDFPE